MDLLDLLMDLQGSSAKIKVLFLGKMGPDTGQTLVALRSYTLKENLNAGEVKDDQLELLVLLTDLQGQGSCAKIKVIFPRQNGNQQWSNAGSSWMANL